MKKKSKFIHRTLVTTKTQYVGLCIACAVVSVAYAKTVVLLFSIG